MSHAGSRSPGASLGLLDATMVGIGAMIGAGIFVLTGLAAETAGPAALLVFGLNGSVTLFTALSYAELASAIPRNGGGYVYVRETFSGAVSFVMGWTRWFTYMAAGGLYALGFSSNFVEFVHLYVPSAPDAPIAYALAIVVLFVTLNALSTEASGGAETVITLLKIAILGVFVAFGVFAVETGEFSPFFPADGGARTVLPAMGLTFIAFQEYDLIATVTEEVENPQKNIPRAIFLSLAATVVIYLLVVMVAIGTGAAPDVFKDNISVPTMAALARARRHLDARERSDVTLIATGGLRTESDFIKAMALGADGVAVANSAMQAIGCLGMRACDSNNCPVGIATQREDLRSRLVVDSAADGLQNFFEATVELMKVMARACGHDSLAGFERRDLTTWKKDIADLTGVEYAGIGKDG